MPDPRPIESLAWEMLVTEAISQAEYDLKKGRPNQLVSEIEAVPIDAQGRPNIKSPAYAPFSKIHARYVRVLSGGVTGKHGGAALDAKAPPAQTHSAAGWKQVKLKVKRRDDDAWEIVTGAPKSFFQANAAHHAVIETQAGCMHGWKTMDIEVYGPVECPAGVTTRLQIRGFQTRVSKRLPAQVSFPVSAKSPDQWPDDFLPWRRPEKLAECWEVKVPSPFVSLPDVSIEIRVWPQAKWSGTLTMDWDLGSDWWSSEGTISVLIDRETIDQTATWSRMIEEKWLMQKRLRETLEDFKRWRSEEQELNPGLGENGLLLMRTQPIHLRLESEGKEAKDHWKVYPDYAFEIDSPHWTQVQGSWEISEGLKKWALPETWGAMLDMILTGSDSGLWLRSQGEWGFHFRWQQTAGSPPNASGNAQGTIFFGSEARLGFRQPGWCLMLFSGSLEDPSIPSLATLEGKADFSGQETGRVEPGLIFDARFSGHGLWGVQKMGWGTASFDPDLIASPVPLAEGWSFPEAPTATPSPLLNVSS